MSSSSKSCRRYQRVPLRLPVTIVTSREEVQCRTVDISYSGLFLEAPRFFDMRQLVKLHIHLPYATSPLEMLAMVVRHVTAEEGRKLGRSAGMGCTFYGNGRNVIREWEGFVRSQMQKMPPQRFQSRFQKDHLVELPIEVSSLEGLHTMLTDALGMGNLHVSADKQAPLGSQMRLIFQNPLNQERFIINAEVTRHTHYHNRPGMELSLLEIDDETRTNLRAFINSVGPRSTPPPPVQAPVPSTPSAAPIVSHDRFQVQQVKTAVPVLGDTKDVVFTGLVTEEVSIIDDFMDDIFGALGN